MSLSVNESKLNFNDNSNLNDFDLEYNNYNETKYFEKNLEKIPIQYIFSHKISKDGSYSFFVKFQNKSYKKSSWVQEKQIKKTLQVQELIEKYLKKYKDSPPEEPYYNSQYDIPKKIVSFRNSNGYPEFLVVWKGLSVVESTWESEHDIDDKQLISNYMELNNYIIPHYPLKGFFSNFEPISFFLSPFEHLNNNNYFIRLYNFLFHQISQNKNSFIVHPTTISYFESICSILYDIKSKNNSVAPILIISSRLSLSIWEDTLSKFKIFRILNYGGTQNECLFSERYEFLIPDTPCVQFNVFLTSFENFIRYNSKISYFDWSLVILDEINTSKNLFPSLNLFSNLNSEFRIILNKEIPKTSTEIIQYLYFLDFEKYFDKFNLDQSINDIFSHIYYFSLFRSYTFISPIINEENLGIEEILIDCEMSPIQQEYYNSIKESFLNSFNLQNLDDKSNKSNLGLLRKAINHPYLICGAEEKILLGEQSINDPSSDLDEVGNDVLVHSSGKLIVLDQLLIKLKDQGSHIALLCQSKRMLDIIQDFLSYKNYKFERIDGQTRGDRRKASIDRFNLPNSDVFIFLICSKEYVDDIKIPTATSVIAFNSNWDPILDINIIKKCEILNSSNFISFYRLFTSNSYEESLLMLYLLKNYGFFKNNDFNSLQTNFEFTNKLIKISKTNFNTLSSNSLNNLLQNAIRLTHIISYKNKIENNQNSNKQINYNKNTKLWTKKCSTDLLTFTLKYGYHRCEEFSQFSEHQNLSSDQIQSVMKIFIKWLLKEAQQPIDTYPDFEKLIKNNLTPFEKAFNKDKKDDLYDIITFSSKKKLDQLFELYYLHTLMISITNLPIDIPIFFIDNLKPSNWWTELNDKELLFEIWKNGYGYKGMTFTNSKYNNEIKSLLPRFRLILSNLIRIHKEYNQIINSNLEFNQESILKAFQFLSNENIENIINNLKNFGYFNYEEFKLKLNFQFQNEIYLKKFIKLLINLILNFNNKKNSESLFILNHKIEDILLLNDLINNFKEWKKNLETSNSIKLKEFLNKLLNQGLDSIKNEIEVEPTILNINNFIKKNNLIISKLPEISNKIEFPIKIGSTLIIHSIGKIVSDKESFHNDRYYYNPGFISERLFTSILDPSEKVWYRSLILDKGENKPIFRVELKDNPKYFFEGSAPSNPWLSVMKALNEKKKKLGLPAVRSLTVSGPEFFGLSNSIVLSLMKNLDNNDLKINSKNNNIIPKKTIKKTIIKKEVEYSSESEEYSSYSPEESSEIEEKIQNSITINFSKLIESNFGDELYCNINISSSKIRSVLKKINFY